MTRQSYTAVVEQNARWAGDFETEPYEAGWAHEAVFFVRALKAESIPDDTTARVQISPDGMHWCDEGTTMAIPPEAGGVVFARVRHFGGFLRLAGHLPEGATATVMVYLALKE